MANNVSFFAIHVDDIARGRGFYERVFGWRFEPWGPPGFYLIHTGDEKNPGILGAMHKRREPVTGKGMTGFECTIAVADIDATIGAIEANGGKIGMAKFTIPTVGTGCYFHDPEGNWVGAMQYETPPVQS
ncbi:MAG TPA: VOC family protein [Candidatus Acidoferrum sp.]|jgi:predicted enzyme related to lactoylglutathione lyase|nr:VOC family protein [Candidatus Acidoferrum sp.]